MNPNIVHLPKGDIDTTPGVWRGVNAVIEPGNEDSGLMYRAALLSCPKCGGVFSIARHNIADTGFVQPSVICGYACGWHEWVTLDGWNGAPVLPQESKGGLAPREDGK